MTGLCERLRDGAGAIRRAAKLNLRVAIPHGIRACSFLVVDEATARKFADQAEGAADRITALTAERDRLRDALTPSAETKAAYIGEFQFGVDVLAPDGELEMQVVAVPWTTVKQIMAAIRSRAESSQ